MWNEIPAYQMSEMKRLGHWQPCATAIWTPNYSQQIKQTDEVFKTTSSNSDFLVSPRENINSLQFLDIRKLCI
jgi:hypothetical protein